MNIYEVIVTVTFADETTARDRRLFATKGTAERYITYVKTRYTDMRTELNEVNVETANVFYPDSY